MPILGLLALTIQFVPVDIHIVIILGYDATKG